MRMSNSVFKETVSTEEGAQTAAQQQDLAIHFTAEMQMMAGLGRWVVHRIFSLLRVQIEGSGVTSPVLCMELSSLVGE